MKTLIFISCIIFSMTVVAQQQITAKFPKATISGKSGGEISADEIISAGALLTTDADFKITHFAFTTKVVKDLVTQESNSDKITNQMTGFIKKMSKGQKLVVEQIEATNSSGKKITFEELIFFIK